MLVLAVNQFAGEHIEFFLEGNTEIAEVGKAETKAYRFYGMPAGEEHGTRFLHAGRLVILVNGFLINFPEELFQFAAAHSCLRCQFFD